MRFERNVFEKVERWFEYRVVFRDVFIWIHETERERERDAPPALRLVNGLDRKKLLRSPMVLYFEEEKKDLRPI